MLKSISINNFKSASDVEIQLGRVNVFIGENGCGKTTILEAIALASAAADNKLDNEFLVSRGIRISDPKLMKSAFTSEMSEENIKIRIENSETSFLKYEINYSGKNISVVHASSSESKALLAGKHPDYPDNHMDLSKNISAILSHPVIAPIAEQSKLKRFVEKTDDDIPVTADDESTINIYADAIFQLNETIKYLQENIIPLEKQLAEKLSKNFHFSNFFIYTPENYFLRRFEEEGQITPLGIRGEGLFKHLVELFQENNDFIQTLSQNLKLISWFEGLEIPTELSFTERRINIKDRFVKATIDYFDQRSANEGFLYLLFYFTLFLSDETPSFFAIDNIDTSLNPKLCSQLIRSLVKLSNEKNKQVILTTHNPAVLDGLDLSDDAQRLFVIYRNADGHTKAKRVKQPNEIEGVEPVRLSEAFIRGYLGGLPKNF